MGSKDIHCEKSIVVKSSSCRQPLLPACKKSFLDPHVSQLPLSSLRGHFYTFLPPYAVVPSAKKHRSRFYTAGGDLLGPLSPAQNPLRPNYGDVACPLEPPLLLELNPVTRCAGIPSTDLQSNLHPAEHAAQSLPPTRATGEDKLGLRPGTMQAIVTHHLPHPLLRLTAGKKKYVEASPASASAHSV